MRVIKLFRMRISAKLIQYVLFSAEKCSEKEWHVFSFTKECWTRVGIEWPNWNIRGFLLRCLNAVISCTTSGVSYKGGLGNERACSLFLSRWPNRWSHSLLALGALSEASAALEQNSTNVIALKQRAMSYFRTGDIDAAQTDLHDAVALSRRWFALLVNTAPCLILLLSIRCRTAFIDSSISSRAIEDFR